MKAIGRIKAKVSNCKKKYEQVDSDESILAIDDIVDGFKRNHEKNAKISSRSAKDLVEQGVDGAFPALRKIEVVALRKLVKMTERWRGYMFNMGYELNQFKKMLTMCEDATIKVRRLVHNFEEKMA